MKERNLNKVAISQELEPDNGVSELLPAGWAEIPHRAVVSGHGRVLADDVLLRLFCEAVSVPMERRQPMVDAFLIRFGSLAAAFASDEKALSGLMHIEPHIRTALHLVHDAAMRVSRARLGRDDIFTNRKLMLDYLISRLAREPIEQFRILFLNDRNRLLADEAQTRGTVNHTPVYPREVARRAMELGAKSIILVHNHPSGDPTPSDGDIAMTHDAQRAAALIGVRVADHIIIGNGAYVSFRDLGLLKVFQG